MVKSNTQKKVTEKSSKSSAAKTAKASKRKRTEVVKDDALSKKIKAAAKAKKETARKLTEAQKARERKARERLAAKKKAAREALKEKEKAKRRRERERIRLRNKKAKMLEREKAMKARAKEREAERRERRKAKEEESKAKRRALTAARREAFLRKKQEKKEKQRRIRENLLKRMREKRRLKMEKDKRREEQEKKKISSYTNRKGRYNPKRVSPYLLFQCSVRSQVIEKNPKASFKELSQEIGALWRSLSDEEKEKYNEMYREHNERRDKLKKMLPVPPKQPSNNYFLFCKDNKKSVATDNPKADLIELMPILSNLWNNANQSVRDAYTKEAAEARKKYNQEKEKFYKKYPNYGKLPLTDFMQQDHVIGQSLKEFMSSS